MPKRFIFLFLILGIIVFLYKITTTEYESLRVKARMERYEIEITEAQYEIQELHRRLAQNTSPAHRILEKKRTGNIKLPEERIVIFTDVNKPEPNIDIEEIFQIETTNTTEAFLGLSNPQKWNTILFWY